MKVLCFAQVAQITGTREVVLDVPPRATGVALWAVLIRLHPALAPLQSQLRLARNGEFVDWEAPLVETDEIALIPPVSGG